MHIAVLNPIQMRFFQAWSCEKKMKETVEARPDLFSLFWGSSCSFSYTTEDSKKYYQPHSWIEDQELLPSYFFYSSSTLSQFLSDFRRKEGFSSTISKQNNDKSDFISFFVCLVFGAEKNFQISTARLYPHTWRVHSDHIRFFTCTVFSFATDLLFLLLLSSPL